jgi:hypothetical protein
MKMRNTTLAAALGIATLVVGCKDDKKTTPPPAAPPASPAPAPATNAAPTPAPATNAAPTPATNTAPAPAPATKPTEGQHNRIPLGETTVGALKLVATMDAPIKASGGGEGAFDLVITGGKPKAVRFWVGTENAEGSTRAKAEEETKDNWHVHVEVPKPLPAGSKFWAEVEPPTGDPVKVSFDVKTQP